MQKEGCTLHHARNRLSKNKFAALLDIEQKPATVIHITGWGFYHSLLSQMPQSGAQPFCGTGNIAGSPQLEIRHFSAIQTPKPGRLRLCRLHPA
jgi:hypothetical protein